MTSVPPPSYVHPGPPPEPPEYPEGLPPLVRGAARWSPWSALLVLLAAFAVPVTLGIVAAIGVAAAGGDIEEMPPALIIGLTYAQDAGFVLAPVLVAAALVARPAAADFGLRAPARWWRAVGLTAAVYAAFVAIAVLWTQVVGTDQKDTLLEDLGVNESAVRLILVLVMVTVLAPVAEEVLFRGYIYRALRNWRGVWPAAVISGVLFGGIHFGSSPVEFLVPLMALGVGLALLYHWTGSLYAPAALHALNNSIAFGGLQGWDWQIAATIPAAIGTTLLCLRALAAGLDRFSGGFATSTTAG